MDKTNINNWTGSLFYGRSEDLIKDIPDKSIDMMICSPPYNVTLGNNKFKKEGYIAYKDNLKHTDYILWLRNIFKALKSKLVTGGRVAINIGDGKNGKIPTHSDIIQFMIHDLKYLMRNTIIWEKHQIGNRLSVGTWCSPKNPSFPTPFEYILLFCNESYRKDGDKEDITVTKEEFLRNSLAMWHMKPETNMKKFNHPAMFPVELPYRLIQQLTYKGDVVLDIFGGAMTTCLAAEMCERRWIGIDSRKEYVDEGTKRINEYRKEQE